jgi:hypothetical protein
MEFSWGFIALFFVIFMGCGRMCGWGLRHRKRHNEVEQMKNVDDLRLSNLEARVIGLGRRRSERLVTDAVYENDRDSDREPARLKEKRKSPLEELQERFIEGRLTVDEYEKELDRLERIE